MLVFLERRARAGLQILSETQPPMVVEHRTPLSSRTRAKAELQMLSPSQPVVLPLLKGKTKARPKMQGHS
jgi:hypothetical protein